MNTLFTPPHLIHNIFLSIMLIGLSALTILSCGEESLTNSQDMQSTSTSGNVMTTAEMQAQAKQMMQSPSPQEISKAFFAMVDKAAAMSAAEIDSLSEEEILELGKPILDAAEGTTTYPQATLEKVSRTLQKLADNPSNVTTDELQTFKQRGRHPAGNRPSAGSKAVFKPAAQGNTAKDE